MLKQPGNTSGLCYAPMDPVGSFQELEEFAVCMFLISCKHGTNIRRILLSRGLKWQNDWKRNETDAPRLFAISGLLQLNERRRALRESLAFLTLVAADPGDGRRASGAAPQ